MSTVATLTREARKAETRRALIDAAGELFARKGIEATSIDEIAASVGLTKGAVYAHFRSKSDLVEEALAAANAVIGEGLLEGSGGIADFFTRIGREVSALLPKIPRQSLLLYLEYLLYVMRDPDRHRTEMRQLRRANAESGKAFEQEIAASWGIELPLPGTEITALLNATGVGLALALAMDERVVSSEAVGRFFAAIGYGLQQTEAVNELLSRHPST